MKFLSFILSVIAFGIAPHADNVAFFSIHLDKEPIELVLEIESNYLGWIFANSKEEFSGEFGVSEYVNKHLKVYLNKELCLLNVCSIEPDNFGHTFIKTQLHRDQNSHIKTMQIDNTCFLKKTDELINVIMIYQQDKEVRGFKMNENRKRIDVEL